MLLRNPIFPRLLQAVVISPLLAVTLVSAVPPKPWPENAFLPLTEGRIASLPETERVVWREYFDKSRGIAAKQPKRGAQNTPAVAAQNAKGARVSRGLKLDAVKAWYASAEAGSMADRVIVWQSIAGGWTKGIDYAADPEVENKPGDTWSAGTFDNNATISELRFLERVIAAAPADDKRAEAWKASFQRGLQYVFDAQYPNGGYPQIYPLVGGYHDAITYNDNAMPRVLEFLADAAEGAGSFSFVPAPQRAEAGKRFVAGVACILKTQIVEPTSRRTVWCQQHDMLTLKPCAARNFEPVAASSSESSGIIRLLMRRAAPTPEVKASLLDAVAWLEKVAMRDTVWDRSSMPSRLVASPGAPPLWARLYELETDTPIFGDRDRLVHYDVGELSPERQKGYSWFADWPSNTVEASKKWLVKMNASFESKKK